MTGDRGRDWRYVEAADDKSNVLGVSFSGGGIRSAAFCLGAYQELSRHGIFQAARYLSGVSGGNCIAGAVTVSHALSDPSALQGESPPWSRGSPEERYLRNHLTYLAPGVAGRLWLFLNFLYGFLLNLLPLLLGAFLIGRLLGLVYHAALPGLGTRHAAIGPFLEAGLVTSVGLLAVALVLVGLRRLNVERASPIQWLGDSLKLASVGVLAASCAGACLGVLFPLLVHWLAVAIEALSLRPREMAMAEDALQRLLALVAILLISLMLAAVAVLLVQRARMPRLQGVLATVSGIGILFGPFLLSVQGAAQRGWREPQDALTLAFAAFLLLIFGLFVHSWRYSMHLYYRERLSQAFVLRRRTAADSDAVVVEAIPYEEPVKLSVLGAAIDERRHAGFPFPELLVCSAVAARDGDVPNKSWAASFTFDSRESGSYDLGLLARTANLEQHVDGTQTRLTLPSMMAISGAAISPNMGRFTLPAFRLLMALLNLRLGVWLPNPFRAETQPSSATRRSLRRRVVDALVTGWREPGAFYVLKEGTGLADTKGRYIHVSDGGHWENLGLVELIRRKCTHIIVIDASAGGRSPLQDIGRAAALARAELGALIELDPLATVPDANGLAQSPVAAGRVVYPDGSAGVIYYARCVLWPGAPMDLQVFRTIDAMFPRHPTANQLFSGEQFDAYRSLGWEVARALLARANIPLDDFMPQQDEGHQGSVLMT